jgi:hypothetical protein
MSQIKDLGPGKNIQLRIDSQTLRSIAKRCVSKDGAIGQENALELHFAGKALFLARPAVKVGLDPQPRSAAESRPVDLQILHHPLHVISGL